MASGSTVLKRVAGLNRSGVLLKPLRYSEVRATLDALGEDRALQLLQEIEDGAVDDPAEYIKKHAAGEPAENQGKRKLPHEFDFTGSVAKRVRALNDSGMLPTPIDFPLVQPALDKLGLAQAMALLDDLEQVSHDVLNPTKYIQAAASAQAEGDSAEAGEQLGEVEWPEEQDEEADDMEENMNHDQDEILVNVGGENQRSMLDVKSDIKWGVNAADLSDRQRIERRVHWLNHHAQLVKQIDFEAVVEALESIGARQAMRVLRRLEESAETVPEPNEFIWDLVARSGWIWTKSDIVDEDSRVAKRVVWLNQFGGLKQPIKYLEVAELLDSLKVQHAMVLLRELENSSHVVDNPTLYIKRLAEKAGVDEIQPPAAQVDASSATAQKIAWLNSSGNLAAPIDLAQVSDGLSQLGETEAMSLLLEVEQKGKRLKDPTSFMKFKLKAKLAASGFTAENGLQIDDETKVLKRIEWLNDYGGLMRDLDYNQLSAPLQHVGVSRAMQILREVEDSRKHVMDPTKFVLQKCQETEQPERPKATPAATGTQVSGPKPALNRIRFSDVAGSLDKLGPAKALEVLQGMQQKAPQDPVSYIRSRASVTESDVKPEAQRASADFARQIKKNLSWLNQYGGLKRKIRVDEVMIPLTSLPEHECHEILKRVQERSSSIPDPTAYITSEARRAGATTSRFAAESLEAMPESEDAFYAAEIAAATGDTASARSSRTAAGSAPGSKVTAVREHALASGLNLNAAALNALAQLPFPKAVAVMEETLLGGKNRQGVSNASEYVRRASQSLAQSIAVERGIAAELAEALGIDLDDDALDELACISRRESHAVIRQLASNPEAMESPIEFIRDQVARMTQAAA